MGATQISTRQIGSAGVNRDDIDITTTTKALIAKIIAGTGVNIGSTGVDTGTGDVTVNSNQLTFNTQTGSYTLVLADANNGIAMNVATANNVTVPPNASVAIPLWTQIVVWQKGAGTTTLVPGAGVTFIGTATTMAYQNAVNLLIQVATDTWLITTGDNSDLSASLLAPTGNEVIQAGTGVIIPRKYTIASGKKTTIGLGGILRIL